jgi:hypothetical protein
LQKAVKDLDGSYKEWDRLGEKPEMPQYNYQE